MAGSVGGSRMSVWEEVAELTKAAQEKGSDPRLWAAQLSAALGSAGESLPSTEVAHLLVSHICWANNIPIAWKFLDMALTANIVPPTLVLALLSARVIPCRQLHPAAYRLFLELLWRHAFSFASQSSGPNYHKIMKSTDEVLYLSQIFGLQDSQPGLLVVEFVFSIVWQLLDASLDDERLLDRTPEKMSIWETKSQDMEIDDLDSFLVKRTKYHERMQKINTVIAVEIIGKFLDNKVTSRILYLACRNMSSHWESFTQRLKLLAANSLALKNSKHMTPEALLQLTSDIQNVVSWKCRMSSQQPSHVILGAGSVISAGQCNGASGSALWLPIDLFLADAMDVSRVASTSAVDVLSGLVKTLQAVNNTTWHDTFLGLWIAALRLVQREKDPIESPAPCLDISLCMLLSITTLAVASVIEEEEGTLTDGVECSSSTNQKKVKQVLGRRHKDLVSSLQLLGDYKGLLTLPVTLTSIANQAAAKAMMFRVGKEYAECVSMDDILTNCSGNLWHLIVEACIARNLLDTSAYFWPGYVDGCHSHVPRSIHCQVPGWSFLMKGFAPTPSMINVLVSTPASSLSEIEKVYNMAINGSDNEKISAATILCGASLIHGWNIQEHTVLFITRLLSPSIPADYSGTNSHLIGFAPFLHVLILGISSFDCIRIFSLHGLIPQLAGALMPICEVFGSCMPNLSWTLMTGEEISAHTVFSNAFILLLTLWKFNKSPLEHMMVDVPPVGSKSIPEYLLLLRNSQLATFGNMKDQTKSWGVCRNQSLSMEPMFMKSFPKLKLWYQQYEACIASSLSSLSPGTPLHEIVDGLLNMMFGKICSGGKDLIPTTSENCRSPGRTESASSQLKLPAWDILEAIPFALDAALTACVHGRLSPRELATGLKDLADFLPASGVTIVSYLSVEVTQGVWKLAFMNGIDWPSPAANISMVEQKIKKILTNAGVNFPSLATGASLPATLPLPLAAFISFTITYKLDRASGSLLNFSGLALSNLTAGCPWPCMPIMTALWSKKVKRWTDFLLIRAACSAFRHNSEAVVQLLKVCFSSILGFDTSLISGGSGVGALLGHGVSSLFSGGVAPVASGFLYLKVYQHVRDVTFMTKKIISLLMFFVREIAMGGLPNEQLETLKKMKCGMRYGQPSLAAAMARVKLSASFGASLVWISGGWTSVQTLIRETLPCWFISGHGLEIDGEESRGMVAILRGYALAYFALLCGTFAWGVDSVSPASKRRQSVLRNHLEFLVSALDGKISLGCDLATWRAYVEGFVGLMVECTPTWLFEVDVDVLNRLSRGLRQWNKEELALALLVKGGVRTMGAAAELIIESNI
ncbi:mediator of RNA polymerase II transcription subunit 33A-like [Malania oleifera]|uniref:mediator of RNA polymerase II transcription subunit 33A-like n=1 Tax=Malania oleifera TaxID=397392 RepID=UPI0025ADF27C|nr:mediator of RNA polymerase II transcription subunit 33A-like [Malania oleifera]